MAIQDDLGYLAVNLNLRDSPPPLLYSPTDPTAVAIQDALGYLAVGLYLRGSPPLLYSRTAVAIQDALNYLAVGLYFRGSPSPLQYSPTAIDTLDFLTFSVCVYMFV